MGDIQTDYGTAGQAITITLAGLAASATVGRESTVIDNTVDRFLDVLVQVKVEVGVVLAPKQILVFAYASVDGTGYTELATGVDAGYTRRDPTSLVFLGAIPVPTASVIYKSRPFSLAQAFGAMPAKWGIVVFNDSGVALSADAGDNAAVYQGIFATTV